MLQIWDAANATNEHVMMWWYEPDPAIELYRGTDYEFTKVHLPSPSVECRESRTPPEDRCSADPVQRRGVKEGACDNIGHTTKKAIASSLRDSTRATPEVDKSPGYYAIRNFNIDDLDLAVVLRDYVQKGKTGQAARKAVCEWVQNNVDVLDKFKPVGYPRTLREASETETLIKTVAQVVGTVATIYVLVAFVLTHKYRKARIMVFAQVQFVFAMLFGLLLVAMSSIMHAALSPGDAICVAQFWFVSLGYTCLLGPLIIKVSAINHLMRASRRMRRVRIKPRTLYLQVAGLACCITIFLTVWTILDPPRPETFRMLVDDGTMISVQETCTSNSELWVTANHFWEGFLILWAFVLAFQSRGVKAEFNESRAVGTMIYSHFVFAALRVIVYLTFGEEPYTNGVATSFLLSLDVISATTIYLVPKWVKGHAQLSKPGANENPYNRFHITASTLRREREDPSTANAMGLNQTNASSNDASDGGSSSKFILKPARQLTHAHSTFSYFDEHKKRKSFDSVPDSNSDTEDMSGSFHTSSTSDNNKLSRRVSWKATSDAENVRRGSIDKPLSEIEESSPSDQFNETEKC